MNSIKKIITGIRPSAGLTIANLIGSVMPILKLQEIQEGDIYIFVATLHGITDNEPDKIVPNVKEVVRDYLALGLNPKRVAIFDQYSIRQEVALLKLYLERLITVSRLARIPTLKDKLRKEQTVEQVNSLLAGYPVMMAADILLQDANLVPVGKDQYSHMEVARELVDAFNARYGKTLVRPKIMNPSQPVNILSLTGEGKMSKSKPNAAIFLVDDKTTIRKKIKKAETAFPGQTSDKLESLVLIGKALAPEASRKFDYFMSKHLAGEKIMGLFKDFLADVVVKFCQTFQEKRGQITNGEVANILRLGGKKARENAKHVISRVENALAITSN